MDLKKKRTWVIRDFALVTSPGGKFVLRKIWYDDRTIWLEMVLAKISIFFNEHCMLRIHPNPESISRKLTMWLVMLGTYFTMLVFMNWKQHLSYICFIIQETLCSSNMCTTSTTILKIDIDKVKLLRKPSSSFLTARTLCRSKELLWWKHKVSKILLLSRKIILKALNAELMTV